MNITNSHINHYNTFYSLTSDLISISYWHRNTFTLKLTHQYTIIFMKVYTF